MLLLCCGTVCSHLSYPEIFATLYPLYLHPFMTYSLSLSLLLSITLLVTQHHSFCYLRSLHVIYQHLPLYAHSEAIRAPMQPGTVLTPFSTCITSGSLSLSLSPLPFTSYTTTTHAHRYPPLNVTRHYTHSYLSLYRLHTVVYANTLFPNNQPTIHTRSNPHASFSPRLVTVFAQVFCILIYISMQSPTL